MEETSQSNGAMRRALRLAATAIAALIGSGFVINFVGSNVQEWAKVNGQDQYLVKYAGPVIDRLANITQSGWLIFFTGWFVGGAVFLWAEYFLRRHAQPSFTQSDKESLPERTLLKPKLIGRIDQFVTGDAQQAQGGIRTILLCNLSIRNLGTPSIVDNWRIEITRQNVTHPCRLEPIPENLPFQFESGPAITLSRSDAIYEKTTAPIPAGSQVRGWIFSTLADVSKDELASAGTRIVVSYDDVTGKRHTAEYTTSNNGLSKLTYFPDGSGGLKVRQPEESKVKQPEERWSWWKKS